MGREQARQVKIGRVVELVGRTLDQLVASSSVSEAASQAK